MSRSAVKGRKRTSVHTGLRDQDQVSNTAYLHMVKIGTGYLYRMSLGGVRKRKKEVQGRPTSPIPSPETLGSLVTSVIFHLRAKGVNNSRKGSCKIIQFGDSKPPNKLHCKLHCRCDGSHNIHGMGLEYRDTWGRSRVH